MYYNESTNNTMKNLYINAKYYIKVLFWVAITVLVWGGALWFGSLGFDQKQGLVLAIMGFSAWLLIFKLGMPAFWVISLEMLGSLWVWVRSLIQRS